MKYRTRERIIAAVYIAAFLITIIIAKIIRGKL